MSYDEQDKLYFTFSVVRKYSQTVVRMVIFLYRAFFVLSYFSIVMWKHVTYEAWSGST